MNIQPPFIVSYSITTKCNLKCKHCYSESIDQAAPDELTTDEAFKLIDDLSKWGIHLLVIDGGEPLCREDLLEVVEYASSKGIRTTIGSNGTLIDNTMARKMLDAGVKAIAISVDGVDAQTHDSFRGVSGTFENTIKGIEACRTAASGVIVPTVLTNVVKLGYNVTTWIGLQVELSEMHNIAMKLANYANIHLVALSSGNYNLILWAHFYSHEHLADFMTNTLGKISGVLRAEPVIQLRYLKGFGQLIEPPVIHDQET